ncbi:vicilin-like seed storage protein At2g18540 [Osmia bicornis bicornis]|uniref:vicilin-like seed storage protein At2g18540 n=1 Tax=Osmia bicornis bicornis TaxID=1437191 RepID=UPI001EAF2771|nr:vicilin-like seed storage protein At2g18540 [Osmia bicornis bicornis]
MAETRKEIKETEIGDENGKREKGARRGRPSNVEVLRRERSQSIGSMANLEEIWKRKRDAESGEEEERQKDGGEKSGTSEWMFNKSNLTERSPEKKKERKEKKGEEGTIIELIKEMGKELGGKMEKMNDNMNMMGKDLRGEMEKLKEEMKRREDKWLEQKREMEGEIEKMKRKIEELERKGAGSGEGNEIKKRVQEEIEKKKEEMGGGKLGERIKELENRWERKEKEERKKNIIIKGIKTTREEMKEKAEEILKITGVEEAIEEAKAIGLTEGGKGDNMLLLKIKSIDLKRKIMEGKKTPKGREERIEEDLTWEERRIQWILRRIARQEREKGKYVWVEHGKIRVEGKWWKWDDANGRLIDGEGRKWEDIHERPQNKGEDAQGK